MGKYNIWDNLYIPVINYQYARTLYNDNGYVNQIDYCSSIAIYRILTFDLYSLIKIYNI
jgi:hypothetical protein